jgi:hypothetical protein
MPRKRSQVTRCLSWLPPGAPEYERTAERLSDSYELVIVSWRLIGRLGVTVITDTWLESDPPGASEQGTAA